jgi:hypothetical protein
VIEIQCREVRREERGLVVGGYSVSVERGVEYFVRSTDWWRDSRERYAVGFLEMFGKLGRRIIIMVYYFGRC